MKRSALILLTLLSAISISYACDHECVSYCMYYYPSEECVNACGCPEYVL